MDTSLDPATRFAMRQLKDFAKPLEASINGESLLFWKWYLLPNEEAEPAIKKMLGIANEQVPAAAIEPVVGTDEQQKMQVSQQLLQTAQATPQQTIAQAPLPTQAAPQIKPDRKKMPVAVATQFARSHGFLEYDPVTETSLKEWQEKSNGSPMGTVGAVALDAKGRLASATSTGGKGFERVGRVSDTPMPAGNYANRYAAVSCTGIGEDIIDESMASKIVLRVTDGMTLAAAFKKSFKEAKALKHEIGAIGIDYKGNVVFQHTTPFMWKSC
ncbi:isoaspartyl peptidase/L-asparaginase [Candidatus Woesearchaeota archaeon]|nr:isoaspartyl peptidase/L-asparaginase [Candidatus Woesearchaeota archaeon]